MRINKYALEQAVKYMIKKDWYGFELDDGWDKEDVKESYRILRNAIKMYIRYSKLNGEGV